MAGLGVLVQEMWTYSRNAAFVAGVVACSTKRFGEALQRIPRGPPKMYVYVIGLALLGQFIQFHRSWPCTW